MSCSGVKSPENIFKEVLHEHTVISVYCLLTVIHIKCYLQAISYFFEQQFKVFVGEISSEAMETGHEESWSFDGKH